MASLADLVKWRDGLLDARLSGVRRVRDQNGEEVEYRSDSELATAIRAADRLIAEASAGAKPSTILFKTSKGI